MIANAEAVDHANGVSGADATLQGGTPHILAVPATSLKIWVRKERSLIVRQRFKHGSQLDRCVHLEGRLLEIRYVPRHDALCAGQLG